MSRAHLPLETESLLIRPLVPGDAGEILLLSQEERFRTWLPSQVYPDAATARNVLAHLIDQCRHPGDPRLGPYVLAVEHRSDRTLIGHVGFSPFDADAEIGFAIAERYQGRGLATEACAAAARWALAAFGLSRILGITAAANGASQRTLERAGFQHREDRIMPFQGVTQPVRFYELPASR